LSKCYFCRKVVAVRMDENMIEVKLVTVSVGRTILGGDIDSIGLLCDDSGHI